MERKQVGLPDVAWKIIDTQLKGPFGESRAEVIRMIVMIYLAERGYIRDFSMVKKDSDGEEYYNYIQKRK